MWVSFYLDRWLSAYIVVIDELPIKLLDYPFLTWFKRIDKTNRSRGPPKNNGYSAWLSPRFLAKNTIPYI